LDMNSATNSAAATLISRAPSAPAVELSSTPGN
jgi:hypothetical protein